MSCRNAKLLAKQPDAGWSRSRASRSLSGARARESLFIEVVTRQQPQTSPVFLTFKGKYFHNFSTIPYSNLLHEASELTGTEPGQGKSPQRSVSKIIYWSSDGESKHALSDTDVTWPP